MSGTLAPNYCYRCGKHVRKGGGRCWYCYAPIERVVRPARKCRFCDEEIGPKALKCPHCGEFQDQGPSSRDLALAQAKAGGAPQITYVIDKAVIQGDQPLLLQGGRPVPPAISGLLTDRTARAIELNEPALIDQEGVKALPAPTGVGAPPGGAAAGAGEASAARGAGSGGALVRRAEALVSTEQGPEGGSVRGSGSLLSRLADFAMSRFEEPAPKPAKERVKDAEFTSAEASSEDKYRECGVCHTEVLAVDGFCFHCGAKLRPEADGRPSAMTGRYAPSNTGHFLMAGLFMGVSVVLSLLHGDMVNDLPGLARVFQILASVMMAVTFFVLLSAFWRRRATLSQLTTIVLFAAWFACAIFVGKYLFG